MEEKEYQPIKTYIRLGILCKKKIRCGSIGCHEGDSSNAAPPSRGCREGIPPGLLGY